MTKLFMVLPLALILCFMVGCQQGEEVAEEATPDELVPSNLKDAHNVFFEGILAEDTNILDKVLSDDVTFGFPGGNVVPRAMFLSFLQSGELFYDTAEHEAVEYQIYGNTAVVTGRSNLAYRFKEYEGFERLAYTATYVWTDREWEMVAWQSTDRDSIAELEEFIAQAKVEEQNKELVKRTIEELNKGNIEIFKELYAPDYGFYSPSNSPKPMSLEELMEFVKMILKAFPDANWSIEELFTEGDRVIVRFIFTGTHEGEFQGIPATGNKVEVSSIIIFRIKNGKVVEEREDADMLGVMMQLGMELKPKEKE